LKNGFIAGDAWAEDRRPLDWNYSKTFLTESGQHLLQLSTDTTIWDRAKGAYGAMEQSWSLADLFDYLEAQSHESRA
jgi:hypothetical protein